jgi:hypothetical protein
MENQPVTAQDALTLWDAGLPVPAFQVETTPERQTHIYGAAFELLRALISGKLYDFKDLESKYGDLTPRERAVAASIAKVAKKNGWAKMVAQHVHAKSPAITIVNSTPEAGKP